MCGLGALLIVLAFASHIGARTRVAAVRALPAYWLDVFFGLSIFGYTVWFIPIFKNFGVVAAIMAGGQGAVFEARSLLATLPGITTLTQADIAFVCLLAIRVSDHHKLCTRTKWQLGLIFALAAFRTIVMSERLALIEIVLPSVPIFVGSRYGKLLAGRKVLWMFFPYFGILLLLLFFGVTEFLRSWVNFYEWTGQGFWSFIVNRLATYYVYAINSGLGAVAMYSYHYNFPVYSFDWLLRFPGVGSWISDGLRPFLPTQRVLDVYADPQFNNISGLAGLVWDFSWGGAAIVSIISGIVFGRAWKSLVTRAGYLRYFYGIFFTGLFDLLREPYLGQGRAFVPIALISLAILVRKSI